MAKKKNVNIDKYMAAKIPYLKVYEDEGLIEIKRNVYTKCYEISDVSPDKIAEYDKSVIRKQIELLLNSFPEDITFQFTIFNSLISQETVLQKLIISPTKEASLNEHIENYDNIIIDNVGIGHNNVKKNSYLTVAMRADIPEEAVSCFKEMESHLNANFNNIYGIEIRPHTTIERLKVLYTMLNPGKNDFGKKADIDDSGEFTFQKMRYMKMTTKDIVAPNTFDTKESLENHIVLNKDTYVRSFFLSSVPKAVSDSLIADLTNISSSMIFSIYYNAIDSSFGLKVTTDNIKDNTVITKTMKRNTVKDRKNKTIIETRNTINVSEESYFLDSAQQVFKQGVANGYNTMVCSFFIVLYAEDMEVLERDTSLLKLSATKFACQVKCLDTQQLKGFQSALPLANCRVDVKRTLDIPKLAIMSPLNVQDPLKAEGLFSGLNAINDNLVLINRKNNANLNGLISGVDFSGKTYQCKREVFNALISSNDKVVVISTNPDDYKDYVEQLGAEMQKMPSLDILRAVEHYGVTEKNRIFKSYFLEALTITVHDYYKNMSKEEAQQKFSQVEQEISQLMDYIDMQGTPSKKELLQYLNSNIDAYGELLAAIEKLDVFADEEDSEDKESTPFNRLKVYPAKTPVDILLLLDHTWNNVIEDKKKGISTWIFVDSIDSILRYNHASDYLMEYLDKCSQMKTIFTMVIQSTVKLISDENTSIIFEDIVNKLGYFKLLNQGPLERRKYAELLNIPNSLINYITNVEPSEGLIITSASNIAFDDSFLSDENNPFYALFGKRSEQYGLH